MDNCIFCKIINKQIPSYTVYEDDFVIAFFDINPANLGHTLVVPKHHAANIFEISEEDLSRVNIVAKKLCLAYQKILWVEHINILQSNGSYAGQEVFHYHMHIIPRHKNDQVTFTYIAQEDVKSQFVDLQQQVIAALK